MVVCCMGSFVQQHVYCMGSVCFGCVGLCGGVTVWLDRDCCRLSGSALRVIEHRRVAMHLVAQEHAKLPSCKVRHSSAELQYSRSVPENGYRVCVENEGHTTPESGSKSRSSQDAGSHLHN